MRPYKISEKQEARLAKEIAKGSIFIYPTDTVYGIGCNAFNETAVQKIKEMKARDKDKPLSIIAPSKEWILNNLETSKEFLDKYLPGPYTLILKKKNSSFLSNISQSETLGIRIPAHKFTRIIQKSRLPFITTSVNLAGEKPASSIEEINPEILEQVNIVINCNKLSGTPSTIILPNGKKLKR